MSSIRLRFSPICCVYDSGRADISTFDGMECRADEARHRGPNIALRSLAGVATRCTTRTCIRATNRSVAGAVQRLGSHAETRRVEDKLRLSRIQEPSYTCCSDAIELQYNTMQAIYQSAMQPWQCAAQHSSKAIQQQQRIAKSAAINHTAVAQSSEQYSR